MRSPLVPNDPVALSLRDRKRLAGQRRREALRARGKCVECPRAPVEGKTRCAYHAAKAAAAQRRRNAKLRELPRPAAARKCDVCGYPLNRHTRQTASAHRACGEMRRRQERHARRGTPCIATVATLAGQEHTAPNHPQRSDAA